VQAAREVLGAWRSATNDMASAVSGAARAMVADFTNVVTAAARVNFASQAEQVRELERSAARMGASMGRDFQSIESQANAIGAAIGKRPQEVLAWAQSVGELTGNFGDAIEAQKGLAGFAASTGRDLGAYKQLAGQMNSIGVAGKDLGGVMGTISAQAEALGTSGGPAALADQFSALGDSVTGFADRGAAGVTKLTALIGELGHGLDRASAARVTTGVLGALQSDPRRWERYLGHHVLDDQGHVADPTQVLKEVYSKARRQFGGGETLRNVLIGNFGAESGMALFNAGKSGRFDEAAKIAGMAPSSKPDAALGAYQASAPGQRDAAAVQLAISSEKLLGASSALGRAADALQQFSANHPIAGTLAANAGAGIVGAATSGVGKAVTGGLTAMGGGGVMGAVKGIGGVALAGAAGYAAGTYLDEKFGLSDRLSSAMMSQDRAFADIGVAENRKALKKQAADRKNRVSELEALGMEHGKAVFAANNEHGENGDRAKGLAIGMEGIARIEKAVRDGLAKSTIKVQNASGGPVAVTAAGGGKGSAGNQSGG
jgi:hypothetical protein